MYNFTLAALVDNGDDVDEVEDDVVIGDDGGDVEVDGEHVNMMIHLREDGSINPCKTEISQSHGAWGAAYADNTAPLRRKKWRRRGVKILRRT